MISMIISAIKVPGLDRNNDNLSPFLAASCSQTDVQRRRNICMVRVQRSMNFICYSFLPGRALTQENTRLMMTEKGRSAENIEAL